MLSRIKRLDKSGVSLMVGYVLLITLAIVMSVIAYNYMKTYLPREPPQCQDGISILIKEVTFAPDAGNLSNSKLVLTLKNNGRFNEAGYLIYASNKSEEGLPTLDLSTYYSNASGGRRLGNSILFFSASGILLEPGDETNHTFNIPSALGEIYFVSITPIRIEEENNREKFSNCVDARTEQNVGEPIIGPVCGNGAVETGETCDDGNTASLDGCSSTCQIETPEVCNNNNVTDNGEFCDGTDLNGQTCITQGFDDGDLLCNSCTFNTSQCVDFTCGNGVIEPSNGEVCDDAGNNGVACTPPSGGSCNYCSSTCQTATTSIGNGLCNTGETCAQEPTACQGQQAQCPFNNICISGSCQPIVGGIGCTNYCISLQHNPPYTSSSCTSNTGQCGSSGGTVEGGGNNICTNQNGQLPICCCFTNQA